MWGGDIAGAAPRCKSSFREKHGRRPGEAGKEAGAPVDEAALLRPYFGRSRAASSTGTSLFLLLVVVVHPPDHHLLPRLVAPVDVRLRVGVVRVPVRVVE